MRSIGLPTGWSKRFKHQTVILSVVFVSPMLLFLNHASDVPEGISQIAMLAGGLGALAGCIYIATHWPSPTWEPMSDREASASWILVALLAVLIAFNGFELFVSHGHPVVR